MLLLHDLAHARVDAVLAVLAQRLPPAHNVPQVADVDEAGGQQPEDGQDPHERGEGHGAQDDDLEFVVVVQGLDVFAKLGEAVQGAAVLAVDDHIRAGDRDQGQGVDGDSRALGKDDADPAWRSTS